MAEIGAGVAPPATRPRALRRRRGDSRVARLRATHSYGFVLGVVLCSLVFAALAPSGRFASAVLVVIESATLVVALWTSGVAPIRSKPIAALLGVAGLAALFAALGDGTAFIATLAIVNATLVGAAIVVIARGAIDQGEVNKQSLRAAIAVYLLLGMFFVFVYGAAASLGDAAFFTQGTDGSTSLRFYFSFVTLATLGYGDYTPAGNFGHLMAITEALLGQLYLVIVIALLVSNFGRKRRDD
jgi:voltage-gated potassium channel